MLGDRQTLASFQSDFYRDNYHKLLNALIISCVIILILISTIIYFVWQHPEIHYYGTTTGGQIIPMTPSR